MQHLTLPSGKKFDQYIERLHITDENDSRHPIQHGNWDSDNAAWLLWREYMIRRFSSFGDVGVKNVREAIQAHLDSLPTTPYMDFADGNKIKELPNQP